MTALGATTSYALEELTVGDVTVKKANHFPAPPKPSALEEADDWDDDPYYASADG